MPFGPENQAIALEALERMGGNLTRWEEAFIASLRTHLTAGQALTPRQVATLEQLYVQRLG